MEDINYNIMRYELNKAGYVEKVFFGCASGECVGYTGNIPNGYETLQEWYEDNCNNVKAWKIVDNNLVYDSVKDEELQRICEQEEEKNSLATHKWVKDKLRVSSNVITDELAKETTGNSLIVIDDTGDYEIPYLKIESVSNANVKVISSNKNILGISAVPTTIEGVEITINEDGTITLNGTATNNIEFDLNGTSSNKEMLFLIKSNIDYAISGLADNVSLSLYSFDGTERTLVSTSSNNVINLSNTHLITQVILNIDSGVTFKDVIINPQIEIGNKATSFIKHEETNSNETLIDNKCVIEDLVSYSGKTIIMIDKEVAASIKYYTHQFLNEKFAEIEVNEEEIKSTVSDMDKTIEGQNQKISQITQSVDEINSKITDVADITISEGSNYASVNLVNVNESEPMVIKIHPINEDVCYLYPKNEIYPSDDLYLKGRTIQFTNTKTNEVFYYELPSDLLYYDEDNYDEFNLSYDSKTCSVTKRVEYIDGEGNKGIKTEEIINYDFPVIPLTSGDYNVSLLSYSSVYIFVQLMAANLYTTQFATKVELSSSITQTKESITSEVKSKYATKNELNTSVSTIEQKADKINLEVAKKVNNSDYTSAQILMKINNDTSSTVIKSDKVDIDAIATFTNKKLARAGTTTINGSNITTGTISTNVLNSDVITTSNFSAQNINADKINGGTITASAINLGNGKFKVDTNGSLVSSGVSISGYVNSSSGKIGNWTISGGSIYGNSDGYETWLTPYGLEAKPPYDTVEQIRWYDVIFKSSDKRLKNTINDIEEKYEQFYNDLKPKTFKYNDFVRPDDYEKIHFGFIAQDIVESAENNNLKDLSLVFGENYLKLERQEIIALNTWQIQKIKSKLDEAMSKIESLENRIKELESDK